MAEVMIMSEYINHIEVIKYHARQIRNFCKDHRCATCPFCTNDTCNFFGHSPDGWHGIEEVKTNENND